jgi:DNA-binding NarL/FixJ family response regulator
VIRRLLKSLATNEIEPTRSEVKPLSDRELQVFSLIGRGFGASRLATELNLSVKTIEKHQAHIKEKLGLHSAAELSEKAAHWMPAFDTAQPAIKEGTENRGPKRTSLASRGR